MVWFFERESERLQYEIRHELSGAGYELVIRAADDEKTIEKFDSASALLARSQDAWAFLLEGGWRPLESRPASQP